VYASAVCVLVACFRDHPPLSPTTSASRRQLVPLAPSPLAHEFLHANAALPHDRSTAASPCFRFRPPPGTYAAAASAAALLSPADYASAAAATRSACPEYPVPDTLYAASIAALVTATPPTATYASDPAAVTARSASPGTSPL
jgi:hypothetical protein